MSTFIPPPLEKPLLYNEPVFHSISPWKNSLINDLNFELNNKGQGIPDDFDYDGNEIDEFVNNLPEIISNQEKKNPSLGSAEEEDCVTLKKKKISVFYERKNCNTEDDKFATSQEYQKISQEEVQSRH